MSWVGECDCGNGWFIVGVEEVRFVVGEEMGYLRWDIVEEHNDIWGLEVFARGWGNRSYCNAYSVWISCIPSINSEALLFVPSGSKYV